ncbi:MAG: prolyl aminopeptidase [Alphaproteobacteria bacterium]
MRRSEPYPDLGPFAGGLLPLDGHHVMAWEQCGRSDGIPVLFLHGGPGAGITPAHRRFFDPERYRIVLYDQRGAGRSTPYADITNNTTAHLVQDIERLRVHLGIERWLVFGGSWGSTLALAYGEACPDRCLGFILRGIFLCRRSEVEWFMTGLRTVFPEAWRRFAGSLPEGERGDLLASYYRRLTDPDPAVHMGAARAWSRYEGECSTLRPSPDTESELSNPVRALALARIEAHYLTHGAFMPEGALLDGLDRIRHLPCVIVQGRYDMICPIVTADEVAGMWRNCDYVVVSDAGHAASEPGIRSALVAATDRFARLLA